MLSRNLMNDYTKKCGIVFLLCFKIGGEDRESVGGAFSRDHIRRHYLERRRR